MATRPPGAKLIIVLLLLRVGALPTLASLVPETLTTSLLGHLFGPGTTSPRPSNSPSLSRPPVRTTVSMSILHSLVTNLTLLNYPITRASDVLVPRPRGLLAPIALPSSTLLGPPLLSAITGTTTTEPPPRLFTPMDGPNPQTLLTSIPQVPSTEQRARSLSMMREQYTRLLTSTPLPDTAIGGVIHLRVLVTEGARATKAANTRIPITPRNFPTLPQPLRKPY